MAAVVLPGKHYSNPARCSLARHPVRHTLFFQHLAQADTEAFEEGMDGMFARVEAPSINLLRIWVCVEPRRLFEGLAHTTAVEALGLDPNKGVMVSRVCGLPCACFDCLC